MHMLVGEFTFHPVGQGCFYTGQIDFYGREFNLVYDCGSITEGDYIQTKIDDYQRIVREIDLLIISHFHDDHVNGLDKLLSNGMECKNVILPYLLPKERLILAVLYIRDGGDDPNYLNFLHNPVEFLVEHGVEKINFIDGFDKDENTEAPKKIPNDGNPNSESIELVFDKEENDVFRKFVLENDIMFEKHEKQLHFFGKGTIARIGTIWEFVFYNKKVESKVLQDFNSKVSLILYDNLNSEINNVNLVKIISNVEKRNQLANIYETSFKDLNLTTLCVYHAPLLNIHNHFFTDLYSRYCCQYCFECCHYCPSIRCFEINDEREKFGTLLMGDYKLDTIKRQDELNKYFNSRWENIFLFQMPHHGSKYNWKIGTRKRSDFIDFCLYLFNYGLGNPYKHPHASVVKSLIDNDRKVLLNDQLSGIKYRLFFD